MAKAASQTAQTAGALLQALADQDIRGVETAVIRAQLLAQMNELDAWTEEKIDLLNAIATAFRQGTAGVGALKLLVHVARDPANPTRLM